MPLLLYAPRWISRLRGRVREHTRAKYAWTLDHYVLPMLGAIPLDALTRADVRRCLDALAARGLSPASVRAAQAVLSALLNAALDEELVRTNVAQRLGRGYRLRAPRVVYDDRQLALFLTTAATLAPELHPLFLACGHAGLRVGEAIGLQRADVVGSGLWVRRTIRMGGREGPTKSGCPRLVEMTGSLRVSLDEACQGRHGADAKVFSVQQAWLFPGKQNGRPIGYTSVSKACRRIATAAGLPAVTPHSLRRSYASQMVARGVPLSWLARQLGHSDPSVTTRYYSEYLPLPRPPVLDEL